MRDRHRFARGEGGSMMGSLRRPVIGAAAPVIDLPDSEGRRWRSTDHAGRTLVVIFHRHIH